MTSAADGGASQGPSPGPEVGSGLSPRARIALPLVLLGLIALSVHRLHLAERPAPGPGPALSAQHRIRGEALGTRYTVTIADADLDVPGMIAAEGVVSRALGRVDELMSTWRADSELVRFNEHRSLEPFPLSADTLEVLLLAEQVSAASGGAFDITVAPLVAAWGFGAGADPASAGTPPDAESLRAIGERVGFAQLRIDPAAGTASKLHPELTADLSAIAKGHVVDRIGAALAELGHTRVLVEVGGEVVARGRKLDGSRWRIAIEEPDETQRGVNRVVELEDRAMATSGDYRNFYERDGKRISHTIDPRTLRPVEHGLASVSVVHDSAALADAWATALEVLGPDEGFALADHIGLAAYFLVREQDGRFEPRWTDAFEAYLVQ